MRPLRRSCWIVTIEPTVTTTDSNWGHVTTLVLTISRRLFGATRTLTRPTLGEYWGFSASCMEVQNMQEDLGFLQFSDQRGLRCIRTTELSDAVTCRPGHFKKSSEDIERGCQDAGMDCYGFQCLCSQYVKAFDVDFFPDGFGDCVCQSKAFSCLASAYPLPPSFQSSSFQVWPFWLWLS